MVAEKLQPVPEPITQSFVLEEQLVSDSESEISDQDSSFGKKAKPRQPLVRKAQRVKQVNRRPPSKMEPKKRFLKLKITREVDLTDFQCKECNENFNTGQALGGHMSRVHPGQSSSYARKL